MADPTLGPEFTLLTNWVEKGGTLIRFAGPAMAGPLTYASALQLEPESKDGEKLRSKIADVERLR